MRKQYQYFPTQFPHRVNRGRQGIRAIVTRHSIEKRECVYQQLSTTPRVLGEYYMCSFPRFQLHVSIYRCIANYTYSDNCIHTCAGCWVSCQLSTKRLLYGALLRQLVTMGKQIIRVYPNVDPLGQLVTMEKQIIRVYPNVDSLRQLVTTEKQIV